MIKTAVEILKEAKSLIDTPEKWTQGSYARTKDGHPTFESSETAARFCSLGAVYRTCGASYGFAPDHATDALHYAVEALTVGTRYTPPVAMYNDSHTHAEVMVMWDKAIELAQQKENNNEEY